MTNANMTREGRYTGQSLQADALPSRRLQADIMSVCKKNDAERILRLKNAAKPKQTRAEQDAARTVAAIADLRKEGGIVAFGAWQTGKGNYKKSRAIPDGAVVWSKTDTESIQYFADQPARPPKAPAHVCAWFAAHPRAQRCVALIGE
jgi:hypothetical protein